MDTFPPVAMHANTVTAIRMTLNTIEYMPGQRGAHTIPRQRQNRLRYQGDSH